VPVLGADDLDDATELVRGRLTTADWRLVQQLSSRLFHPVPSTGRIPAPLRLWQKLVVAGLPRTPDPVRRARLRAELPGLRTSEPVEELVGALALVEEAVDELAAPTGVVRRTRRRATWLAEAAAARVRGRQAPPTFPYGL
jgi:hypothetical protein